MAMAQNVQIPARKPAVEPQVISVIWPGLSARNMARFTAINRENIAVKPNTLAGLPFFISSSVSLLSIIQALPKMPREYHIPPTANAEIPATITASQLIDEGFMCFRYDFSFF